MDSHLKIIHLLSKLVIIINEMSQLLVMERLGFIHFHFYKLNAFEFKTERLLAKAKIIL